MTKQAKNVLGVIIIALIIGFYFYVTNLNDNANKDSEYYTNSLYTSEERIYNNFLTDDEKEIYDLLFSLVKKRTKIYDTTFDELNCDTGKTCGAIIGKTFYALNIDHPEILGIATYSYSYNKTDKTFQLKLVYATPFTVTDYFGEMYIMTVLEKVKEETADMTDGEKIKYVYEWIGDNTYYDYTFMRTSKNQSAYNAIVKGNAVCAGFAKASAIMLNYIGVETYTIVGHSHMWNVVKYDGKYYYYDSTVAACRSKDSSGYYDGLLQSYMNDYSVYYPEWNFEIEDTNMDFMESKS